MTIYTQAQVERFLGGLEPSLVDVYRNDDTFRIQCLKTQEERFQSRPVVLLQSSFLTTRTYFWIPVWRTVAYVDLLRRRQATLVIDQQRNQTQLVPRQGSLGRFPITDQGVSWDITYRVQEFTVEQDLHWITEKILKQPFAYEGMAQNLHAALLSVFFLREFDALLKDPRYEDRFREIARWVVATEETKGIEKKLASIRNRYALA